MFGNTFDHATTKYQNKIEYYYWIWHKKTKHNITPDESVLLQMPSRSKSYRSNKNDFDSTFALGVGTYFSVSTLLLLMVVDGGFVSNTTWFNAWWSFIASLKRFSTILLISIGNVIVIVEGDDGCGGCVVVDDSTTTNNRNFTTKEKSINQLNNQ